MLDMGTQMDLSLIKDDSQTNFGANSTGQNQDEYPQSLGHEEGTVFIATPDLRDSRAPFSAAS